MSKTQRVLIFAEELPTGHYVYDQHGEEGEPDEGHLFAGVFLDKSIYNDLEKPERITVTIEPGDTLNES